MRCDKCLWFWGAEGNPGGCRQASSVPAVVEKKKNEPTETGLPECIGVWPMVDADSFCGDFREK